MKILAFSDTHGSKQKIRKLKNIINIENPDVIVCAGDITNFEDKIRSILIKLNSYKKPVVIIHGNHESIETFKLIKYNYKNINYIHGKSFKFNNYLFIGFGGGGFSEIDSDLKKASKRLEHILDQNKGKKIIMVTHGPPYGTKLDRLNKEFTGSKTLTDFIKKNKPELLICGHIHENEGKQDFMGKTKIVNPGPIGKILVV